MGTALVRVGAGVFVIKDLEMMLQKLQHLSHIQQNSSEHMKIMIFTKNGVCVVL